MTTRPDHATVELRFRELLASHALPEPDEVAHWRDAVLFGWRDTKALVIVELDELDELEDLEGLDPAELIPFGVRVGGDPLLDEDVPGAG